RGRTTTMAKTTDQKGQEGKNVEVHTGTPEVPPDMVAKIREWGVIPGDRIPAVNQAYTPLADVVTRPMLKVWGTQTKEVIAALRQIADHEAQLQADLGPFAPAPGAAQRLLARFQGAIDADRRA